MSTINNVVRFSSKLSTLLTVVHGAGRCGHKLRMRGLKNPVRAPGGGNAVDKPSRLYIKMYIHYKDLYIQSMG